MALDDKLLLHPLTPPIAPPRRPARPRLHALAGAYRHGLLRTLAPYRRVGAYAGAGLTSGAANLALFHVAVRAHVAPHVAWAVAFELGALLAFILHRHITWRDRRVRTAWGLLRQLWRAQAGALLALILNLTIFTILMRAGLPDDLDDVFGLAAGFALNYALAHHFVFAPRRVRLRHH